MKPHAGVVLAAVALLLLAVAVCGLALHPAFQPVTLVRLVAPAVGLVCGAAFTHRLARRRSEIDVPGEFDPGGRALWFGVVMLVVTVLAWLDATQAVPALWTGATGERRGEAATVVAKVPVTNDAECSHRLELTSASVPRATDQCVDAALWARAQPGSAVTAEVIGGALGAEIIAVRP